MDECVQLKREIAKQQRICDDLRQNNEHLQARVKRQEECIITASHELRTPLASVRAFAEILRGDPNLELSQRREFLDIVVRECERLTRLVDDVLDITRLDGKQTQWQQQTLDLRSLVWQAAEANSLLFRERGMKLILDLGVGPIEVSGDGDRLTQVVSNLLSNAAKFCARENGRIAVQLHKRGQQACLRVADNGSGIPQADLQRIFEPFYRVDEDIDDKAEGSGLGMAISHRIVAHHSGRIWAESEPGQGAVFIVELPLVGSVTR